jgi:membrane protein involved in colicin uptake
MKSIYRIAGAFAALFVLAAGVAPDAQAFRGRGAAFAVGAAVGSSSSSGSSSETAAAQQQAAAAQQQAAAAQQQAAAAEQRAAEERKKAEAAQKDAAAARQQAAAAGPLPMGTVVGSLPPGCAAAPSGGVTYYKCGGNTYQAVFEGSTLKYVTTTPK